MHLMKLHPAPWRVIGDLDNSFLVLDANGQVVPRLVKMIGPISLEVVKKIVLAINAENAIMETGIYPVPVRSGFSVWCLHPSGKLMPVYKACGGNDCTEAPPPATGPFEAIADAVKWLSINKKLQTKHNDSASAP